MTSIDDASPVSMLLTAQRDMYEELKHHRVLFSDIKESVAEQRQTYAALSTSIDNLATSIDRHEHIVEKVLAIESWRINAKLEERIATLETWKIDENIIKANWKGRFAILAALTTLLFSAGLYITDMLIRNLLTK